MNKSIKSTFWHLGSVLMMLLDNSSYVVLFTGFRDEVQPPSVIGEFPILITSPALDQNSWNSW